jgi:peptidoglycan/LPS O-acetylase OafA/YrhL
MSSNRQRRQDLDILRGVAVVGVVAYHYFPLRFSQGLNGVDVFLVISGYLVTQSLLELQPIRAPSLLKFYFRRIRRTVPALVATLTCCLTLAFFTLNDYQLRQLARSSFYAVTFQINFSLHYSIDYFNPDNRTNPLMHLWSLHRF